MELSALIVVGLGTLLFIGFPLWMAWYSRWKSATAAQNDPD